MRSFHFPLDHFGLISGHLQAQLLQQTGDKRKRKSALKNLTKLAKITKQIPENLQPDYVGLLVDASGQITLSFLQSTEDEDGP